jgi:hypothetical protein
LFVAPVASAFLTTVALAKVVRRKFSKHTEHP